MVVVAGAATLLTPSLQSPATSSEPPDVYEDAGRPSLSWLQLNWNWPPFFREKVTKLATNQSERSWKLDCDQRWETLKFNFFPRQESYSPIDAWYERMMKGCQS